MSTSALMEDRGGYLYIRISGDYVVEEIRRHLVDAREEAERIGTFLLLFDAMDLAAPKQEFDRFALGMELAKLFLQGFRVAAFCPTYMINKFTEDTAANRGVTIHVCGSEEEALRWLLS
ncbi:MAG: hypothetical protein H6727_17060 [Myxococcales bacterium]|nr:hypothetical protein [Myxococcales bacterium]